MKRFFYSILPLLLVMIGIIAASVGVAMIYLPAGIIFAGTAMTATGVLMMRGDDGA
ncbi:MAG: hypothetical protein Q3985_01255 [Eubacteriales bacterium]|nr:hypothetical protein [Eubacteriales bacterium]